VFAAPIVFRTMPCQVAGVMKNTGDFDDVAATAVEQKVPRFFHAETGHSVPAELEMVRPGAFDHNLRTFPGAGTLGIFAHVTQGLLMSAE